MKPLDSPLPFRKWLAHKDPKSVVGYPRKDDVCPLANYLNEGLKTRPYHVSMIDVRRANNHEIGYLLPWWALCFVEWVDSGRGGPILAKDALSALDQL